MKRCVTAAKNNRTMKPQSDVLKKKNPDNNRESTGILQVNTLLIFKFRLAMYQ